MRFDHIRRGAVLLLLLSGLGCSSESDPSGDKLQVTAGLPPVAHLVRAIGGDRVRVVCMLPEGRTPHDFTPRTPEVRQAAQTRIFFTTGMPFERRIAGFLNAGTTVCDTTAGIRRIPSSDGSGTGHHHHHHDDDGACSGDDGDDPHVWLSARNAAVMADNIAAALAAADPDGAEKYRANCAGLKAGFARIDAEISRDLAPFAGKTFFVYHPAFGYFAADYGLRQRAVELDGREAGAAQLAAIIREAGEAGATTVFVQKQFNPRTAKALADRIGGTVAHLDPLAGDLPDNLRRMAAALRRGFLSERK